LQKKAKATMTVSLVNGISVPTNYANLLETVIHEKSVVQILVVNNPTSLANIALGTVKGGAVVLCGHNAFKTLTAGDGVFTYTPGQDEDHNVRGVQTIFLVLSLTDVYFPVQLLISKFGRARGARGVPWIAFVTPYANIDLIRTELCASRGVPEHTCNVHLAEPSVCRNSFSSVQIKRVRSDKLEHWLSERPVGSSVALIVQSGTTYAAACDVASNWNSRDGPKAFCFVANIELLAVHKTAAGMPCHVMFLPELLAASDDVLRVLLHLSKNSESCRCASVCKFA
jgi:hypothetical protein